ncbi:MAG: 4Fe-4S dicluster domain-containing protein [Methanomassiliicoccales archaeon]|nr:MAG: 4Fe-4S dicluster domain-containing protein [Methanomassiliicoccales archaeon]
MVLMAKAKRRSPGVKGWVIQPLRATFRETMSALLKPETILYPYESKEERDELRKYFRGQHRIDWLKCIGCQLCSRVCPNDCITMEKVKVGEDYQEPSRSEMDEKKNVVLRPGVNIGRCLFCGNCSEYCPTGAWVHTSVVELADFSRDALVFTAEQLKIEGKPTKELKNRIEENPKLDEETCIGCKRCARECPTRCIVMIPGKKMRKDKPIENPKFDYSICIGCGTCAEICPSDSLTMEEI